MWTNGLKRRREMRISGVFGLKLQRGKGWNFRSHDEDHHMVCYMGGLFCRPALDGKNSKPRIPLRLRSRGQGTFGCAQGYAQEDGAPSIPVE
jgi:hypothetical protein